MSRDGPMLASMENHSSDVPQSGEMSKTTRVEWMPGVHFIFITERRELKRTELDELCKKYFSIHRKKRVQLRRYLLI
jgi:hypothetical protein